MRMVHIVGFVFVVAMFHSTRAEPVRKAHSDDPLLARITLHGEAKEEFTCFQTADFVNCSIIFSVENAQVRVIVERLNEKGQPNTIKFTNDGGTLPIITGRVKSVKVEFVSKGELELSLHRGH
jgi:hypothetical protein